MGALDSDVMKCYTEGHGLGVDCLRLMHGEQHGMCMNVSKCG